MGNKWHNKGIPVKNSILIYMSEPMITCNLKSLKITIKLNLPYEYKHLNLFSANTIY